MVRTQSREKGTIRKRKPSKVAASVSASALKNVKVRQCSGMAVLTTSQERIALRYRCAHAVRMSEWLLICKQIDTTKIRIVAEAIGQQRLLQAHPICVSHNECDNQKYCDNSSQKPIGKSLQIFLYLRSFQQELLDAELDMIIRVQS